MKDFIDEYEYYPQSAHDDQLDSLEMAINFISAGCLTVKVKTAQRRTAQDLTEGYVPTAGGR